MKVKTEIQTFNGGVVLIYRAMRQGGGEVRLRLKKRLRYDERTVGIGRYYQAKQENVEIEMLLRIPKVGGISTQDVAVVEGRQYHIRRMAYPKDTEPPCWDISLERAVHDYDFERA